MPSKSEILDCGHLPSPHSTVTTGYGVDADGKKYCYGCCAARTRQQMIETGRATLYFVTDGKHRTPNTITDWPGTLDFPAFNITRSTGSGFGRRYPIVTGRFRGPDGKLWAFRNAGDMDIARCRRLKDPR